MNATSPTPRRPRDAERTRSAVLDAAEHLFAEQGYEAASMEAIGRRAGVSRGTPGYFFSSKEALYRAVLVRILTAEAELLLAAHAHATAADDRPDAVLGAIVDTFLNFLNARPSFVRLIEREAAAGGTVLRDVAAETPAVADGMAALRAFLAEPAFGGTDPADLLLSVLALCWFPIAHADTFTRALGVDPDDPAFRPAWRQHVVALVLGTGGTPHS